MSRSGCLLPAATAAAHGVGMSQIELRVDGSHIEGEWEINLRDARLAVGLDPPCPKRRTGLSSSSITRTVT